MARVTLIRPPSVSFPKSLSGHGPVPPIGVAYLAAVLRQGGHRVDVIDAPGEAIDEHHDFTTAIGTLRSTGLTPEAVVDRIPADVQIIGVTNMFLHEWPQVLQILELARARFPEATLVVGGENATAYWPWMFEETEVIDLVVTGEGEATALELADRVAAGLPLHAMAGVVLPKRQGQEAEDGGLPTRLRQLSEIPEPAWDLLPVDNYLDHADYFGVDRGRSMPVMATRGCPYKCSFCSSPQMWTTRYVVREPEDVAKEIAGYVERYDIANVDFCDLTAITKRQWTLRFCDSLDAQRLDITWQLPVGTRAEALDAEVLQRLYDTGCRNVTYAPESGSKRMLEIFDKRVDLDHILRSLRAAHRIGLRTHVNVIIGHPDEKWRDVLQSALLLVKAAVAGADTASAIMFGAYPGSADFRRLLDEGALAVDDEFLYIALSRGSSAHRSYNPRMSSRQLRSAQLAIMMTFYGLAHLLHPSRVLERFRAQRGGQELTHFDQYVRIKRESRHSPSASTPV